MEKTVYDPGAIGLDIAKNIGDDELLVTCPYHDDSKPSAEYNIRKGLFVCFACGAKRNAEQLAEDLGGSLVKVATVDLGGDLFSSSEDAWRDLLKWPLALGNEYLAKRGVTDGQVTKFGILQHPDGVIFPMLDFTGKVVALQMRRYDGKPKYKTYGNRPPVWPVANLMGLSKEDRVFIVEGVFGVLRADSAGFKAVATLGAASVGRVCRLVRTNGFLLNRTYSIMDNDKAGWVAACYLLEKGSVPAIALSEAPDEISIDDWQDVNRLANEMAAETVGEFFETVPPGDRKYLSKRINKIRRKVK